MVIIAEQKGEPLVVILEIQAFAHTRGQLVDEAENAAVGAGVLFVPQVGGEIAAEVLPRLAGHIPFLHPAGHPGRQVKAGAVGIELVIQCVVDGVAVHRQQLIPGAQAQGRGVAAGGYRINFHGHGGRLLSSKREEGEGAARPPLLSYIHDATK